MKLIIWLLLLIVSLMPMNNFAQVPPANISFTWQQFDRLPGPDGFAGSYAGVSNGALIVAGGTNFPGNKRPWTNGTKTWYDEIFVLEHKGASWKTAGKLPRPLGYGLSFTYADGVVCLGGGDAERNYAEAFIIKYKNAKISIENLPQMPFPLINAAGVISGDMVYVSGGIKDPRDTTHTQLWRLNLSMKGEKKWEILENFPGTSRMLACAGAMNNDIYIFGGVHLKRVQPDSLPVREYLKDCWKYTAGKGWKRVADLPYTLAGAPYPAYNGGHSYLLLFGGDDGINAPQLSVLKDNHPGFRNEIIAYNTVTDLWSVAGSMPVDKKKDAAENPGNSVYAPVTTPLVMWNKQVVIPGGEARPAVRSNKVLVATQQ